MVLGPMPVGACCSIARSSATRVVPAAQITYWRQSAPWAADEDVEQDLLISRSIVELFNRPLLHERLAFRGGTALHKLVLAPATRYSEDIDLVYLVNEPIGTVLTEIRDALAWFPIKALYAVIDIPKLYFRFPTTTTGITRKIKVEIQTHETFSASRTVERPYSVISPFFTGATNVRTYPLEELLATKLRALYQRKKGRDLYDLWYAAQQQQIDFDRVYELFTEYWNATGLSPLRQPQLLANITQKQKAGIFAQVAPLLVPGAAFEGDTACAWFLQTVVPRFPA